MSCGNGCVPSTIGNDFGFDAAPSKGPTGANLVICCFSNSWSRGSEENDAPLDATKEVEEHAMAHDVQRANCAIRQGAKDLGHFIHSQGKLDPSQDDGKAP